MRNISSSAIRAFFTGIPLSTWGFVLAFALLAAARWTHFGPDIEQPHDWRQFDTAQYIRAFDEDGFDLLHPSVGWMGGHKTLILEFPLPEAMVAVLYRMLGPDILWARLVTWLFFCGGCLYLYRILALVGTRGMAALATCIYMALPLGFFYSRAVHIDFVAVFFAHGMAYHLLKSGSWRHLALAGLMAALGFLIKAPYEFYLLLPCLAYAWRQGALRTQAWKWALALTPAVLLFVAWTVHASRVNAAAPDWDFIPYYRKFDSMWDWYFGTLNLRGMGMLWERILERIRYEVAGGFPGAYLAAAGLAMGWRRFAANFMRWWVLGTVIYLLIFFPLNFNHDYYQIPFLAPVAYLIALVVQALADELGKMGAAYRAGVQVVAVLLLFLNTWRLTHQMGLSPSEQPHFHNYFKVDHGIHAFGKAVEAATPPDALVVVSNANLDCRAPHLPYLAHRYGWSIKHEFLHMRLLADLKAVGATHLAVHQAELLPANRLDSLDQAYARIKSERQIVDGRPQEVVIWRLSPK